MDEPRVGGPPAGPADPDDEPTLLDYAAVVWRHRGMIVGLVAAACAAALAWSLLAPKVYEATATLVAPGERAGGVLGALPASGLQALVALPLPSLTPNRDLLVSVLKSRTVAQAVVDRFGLQARYRARFPEDAVRTLQERTDIRVSREGVISVRVEDTDPTLAADMANFYVEELDRLVARYTTGEAARQRLFLTEQLARARADLDAAQEALRRFQERHRRRLEELRRQLAQTQWGEPAGADAVGGPGSDRRDFVVPLPKVPGVGTELARLTSEAKVQETLVTLLTVQVAQAHLEEARDLPVVRVLDRAAPPQRHAKPKTRLNLALAGVTSLLTGILLAFVLDSVARARSRARPAHAA